MQKVTVIAFGGASIAGPAKVKLTKQQWQRRERLLGNWKKSNVYSLDGGEALSFKAGETIGVDTPQKLNRQLFEWPEEEDDVQNSLPGMKGDDTVTASETVDPAGKVETVDPAVGAA